MLLVSQRSTEDHAKAFARAFVEISADLHKVVGSCLQIEVRHGCVVLGRKQFHEFLVILNLADDHRTVLERSGKFDGTLGFQKPIENTSRDSLTEEAFHDLLSGAASASAVPQTDQEAHQNGKCTRKGRIKHTIK